MALEVLKLINFCRKSTLQRISRKAPVQWRPRLLATIRNSDGFYYANNVMDVFADKAYAARERGGRYQWVALSFTLFYASSRATTLIDISSPFLSLHSARHVSVFWSWFSVVSNLVRNTSLVTQYEGLRLPSSHIRAEEHTGHVCARDSDSIFETKSNEKMRGGAGSTGHRIEVCSFFIHCFLKILQKWRSIFWRR